MGSIYALVLCGGKGKRLKGAVSDRPKPMATVNGRPFLDHMIQYLENSGIVNIVLGTGYMAEYIRSYYAEHKTKAKITFSEETSPLGTAGAVKLALPMISSDPFFVLNGDSLCRASLTEMLEFHLSKKAGATVLLSRKEDISDYGSVEMDNNGRITGFLEKQPVKKSGFVNAGTYLLTKDSLNSIPEGKPSSLEYDVFPSHSNVFGFATNEDFIDIGTEERFAQAQVLFGRNKNI